MVDISQGTLDRIIEIEGTDIFSASLFPYQIKNRELFYQRKHPKELNPRSVTYKKYWGEVLRKSVEGYWVFDIPDGEKDESKGTWIFMFPKLYFYINNIIIPDENRRRIYPRLRDNEWIMSSYYTIADGFSGFEGDELYTCSNLVRKIELGEELAQYEIDALATDYTAKDKDGNYKKYIDPWIYLTEHYLITHNQKKPLGLPVYFNQRQNIMLLGARKISKSFWSFLGDFMHEFLLNGITRMDQVKDIRGDMLFALASQREEPLEKSLNNISRAYSEMPGKYGPLPRYGGAFYKNTTGGEWSPGNTIKHKVQKKNRTDEIVGNQAQLISIKPNNSSIVTGDRFRRIYIEETGFCFAAGTKVRMFNGSVKNVENIQVGDEVMGHNGTKRTVKNTQNGYDNMYTVKQTFGNDYTVSSKHKICTKVKKWKNGSSFVDYKEVYAKDFNNNDYLKTTYGYKNETLLFKERDLLLDPYWYGSYIGDGCTNSANIVIDKKETEIIEYYDKLFQSAGYSLKKHTTSGGIYSIYPKKPKGAGKYNKYRSGLKYYNSFDKKYIHEDFILNSRENRLQFLAGLIDTDGCYVKTKTSHYFEFYQTNRKELVDTVMFLCTSLGLRATLRKKVCNKGYDGKILDEYRNRYTIAISGDIHTIPTKCPRKIAKKRVYLKDHLNTSISVESCGMGEYFGFELEESPLFLLKDGTVVHNCTNITDIFSNCDDSLKVNKQYVGSLVCLGTGGDTDKIEGSKKMFESPGGYNIVAIPDYFNRVNIQSKTGLFIPYTYSAEEFKDEQGNTKIEEMLKDIIRERMDVKAKRDSIGFLDYIMFNPIYPKEMLIPKSRNRFPTLEMAHHRADLIAADVMKNKANIGTFVFDPSVFGGVRFEIDHKKELVPLTDWGKEDKENNEGAFIMYEDSMDEAPDGLYYVLIDPVAQSGKGASLNTILVYKADYQGNDDMTRDNIVGEWTGRHHSITDTYETCIKIAKYYNAQIVAETNIPYFVEWCKEHEYFDMLYGEPARTLQNIHKGKFRRSYYAKGIKMNKVLNDYGYLKLSDWFKQVTKVDKDGVPTRRRYHDIKSLRVLSEAISFDPEYKTQFDSISTLYLLMILKAELEGSEFKITLDPDESYEEYEDTSELEPVNRLPEFLRN